MLYNRLCTKKMMRTVSLSAIICASTSVTYADSCSTLSSTTYPSVTCSLSDNKLVAVIDGDVNSEYSIMFDVWRTNPAYPININLEEQATVRSLYGGVSIFGLGSGIDGNLNTVNVNLSGNIIAGNRDQEDLDWGHEISPIGSASLSIRTGPSGAGGFYGRSTITQDDESTVINSSGSRDSAAVYSYSLETELTTSGRIQSSVGDAVRFDGFRQYINYPNETPIAYSNKFDVHVKETGSISGGSEGAGITTYYNGQSNIVLDKNTQIGALSDVAIQALGDIRFYNELTQGAVTKITNAGQITGIIKLSSGEDTVVNEASGIWYVRHHYDSNRDGIRDTVAPVAVSDFGGGVTQLTNYGLVQLASNNDGLPNTALFKNLASFENHGVLSLSNTVVGDRFTIDGNYIGNNGAIELESQLVGDASITDTLTINGNAFGSTNVVVTNVGGTGSQTVEGIKIIEVGGTSAGAFKLQGDYVHGEQQAVVSGAYAYKLYQGGVSTPSDGNWYLRSQLKPTDPVEPEPLYQAGVPVYEAYSQALLGLNGISTLQQRTGNRVWTGNGNRVVTQGTDTIGSSYAAPDEAGAVINGNGVWGRIEGSHNHMEPRFSTSDTNYDQNVFKMQAGIDGMLTETEKGKLIGGFTVHYAHGKTKTNSAHGDGDISTDGYGLGGTLTWYGENGFYLNGQGQVTWYRSDLHSTTANTGLTDNNHGFGYALSLEGGQRFAINEAWSLTPQAQLTYSNVDFDAFTDAFGADVSLDRGEGLQGRLGLTVDHENSWQNADGLLDRARVYGIANLYYEFLKDTRVNVAESSFTSRNDLAWGGLGLGGSYNWNDDKYSIYGEGLVNTSLNNFGDSFAVKGNVGFRVKW